MCYRFYRNISMINGHLSDMRDFLEYSIQSMDTYMEANKSLTSYSPFLEENKKHREVLAAIYKHLVPIRPFCPGFSKIVEIGYLLRCFYELYVNEEYAFSIRYAIGFEGYINNLTGIFENVLQEKIHMAKFSNDSVEFSTKMHKLYYPAYVDSKDMVKNTCDLSSNIIITGPNASGKTTLLKAATINIIFTQQFGCGFYDSCNIKPYTHIHSYLNIPDTSGRDSLFQAESRRCKEIITKIHEPGIEHARHFCIFDELYSGTNPTEASKSAYAFLLYLSKYQNVDFILTTHYVSVCKRLDKKLRKLCENKPSKYRAIKNYKMDVLENSETGSVKYTYKMKNGISKIQGAILILEDMCYPREILDEVRRSTKK